jgi:hypothetical protein
MLIMTQCSSCGCNLTEEEAIQFRGKTLCEDCYMQESNPPKACDPLAVASAVSLRKQMGQRGADGLTEQQKKIYHLIMERRKITRQEIQQTLNLTPKVLESEFATLRHCELIRAHKEGSNVYLTIW